MIVRELRNYFCGIYEQDCDAGRKEAGEDGRVIYKMMKKDMRGE